MRDTGHDVGDDLLHDLPGGDVVEEEQRFGSLHRDVVDRTGDEVDADGVVDAHEPRDQRLRPHAVGRRHEDRVAQAPLVEREQATEAADVADHFGTERRAHVLLDELDRTLTGGDVDTGRLVGQWLVLVLALGSFAHRAALGASSSSTSFESVSTVSKSGIAIGYSPDKQAAQNDPGDAPVAAIRRSSSR